jgi:hypothetical protein
MAMNENLHSRLFEWIQDMRIARLLYISLFQFSSIKIYNESADDHLVKVA